MKAFENVESVIIPSADSEWFNRSWSQQIGVRARSFVPSIPNNDFSSMIQNKLISVSQIESLRKLDDNELIAMFQNGDREVFRILVERYQERIRNLLYSIFHDKDFIDDLAQEVFVKVYQALPRFRFEASFYTWLYRIAVNRSRDELRKKKIRRFFSFQPLDEGIEAELHRYISVAPENRDTQEIVALGLQTLPEKFRTAVVLKDIDGLSYEEIAKVMHCELGTVKSRISRARTMLRKALKPLLEEVQ
jgi:RNA polymerase sigma-70 factor (ECF subfamily)